MKCVFIVFTCFKYGEDPQTYLQTLAKSCDYLKAQLEKSPDTGRLHLQGVAWCRNPSRWGQFKKTMHIEKCKDFQAAKDYCGKEETRVDGPWEFGEGPKTKNGRPTNAELIKGDLRKMVEEERIPLISLPKLMIAKNLYLLTEKKMDLEPEAEPIGVWIYGTPGSGKSYACRSKYQNLFFKQMNKWWDGYQGEDTVLIDDFEKEGKVLGHYIKIWADCYAFSGEVKGGSLTIKPKRLLVTSNYMPEEIWKQDEDAVMLAAILRRFKIVNFRGREDIINI